MAYYDPEGNGNAIFISDDVQRMLEEERRFEIGVQHSEYSAEETDAALIEYKQHFCQTLGSTAILE